MQRGEDTGYETLSFNLLISCGQLLRDDMKSFRGLETDVSKFRAMAAHVNPRNLLVVGLVDLTSSGNAVSFSIRIYKEENNLEGSGPQVMYNCR